MTHRIIAIVLTVTAALAIQSSSVFTQSTSSGPFFITDLGTFGGARSDAFGINDRGEVAGSAQHTDSATHAFLYDTTLRDLGTVGGGTESAALGIARLPMIVGRAVTALGNTKGFVRTSHVAAATTVSIRAAANGVTRSAALTVQP